MKVKILAGLLALTDSMASSYKNMIDNYIKFFKSEQGSFNGERVTYKSQMEASEDEEREKSKFKAVVTTVDEKLKWFEDISENYLNAMLSLEATNASGTAKADLVVDGFNLGNFSSLELMRLKGILQNAKLEEMYRNIPKRTETEEWFPSSDDERNIFESEENVTLDRTTEKESYILHDPNINSGDHKVNYTPSVAVKSNTIIRGKTIRKKYSGEYTHKQVALILKRRSDLLAAIKIALEEANKVAPVESEMNSKKLFNYLHRGQVD